MRIRLVTQYFDPEPTLKGMVFAEGLAQRGHEVRVLTGFPNYPQGSLYDGFSLAPHTTETIRGIHVDRVWLYPSHDSSVRHRAVNYASFAASSSVSLALSRWKPDVMWVHHPPISAAFGPCVSGLLRKVPVALEIQDLWPQSLQETSMVSSAKVLSAVDRSVQAAYRAADRIICISEGMRSSILERGIPEEKVCVIPNWADEDRLAPSEDDHTWAGSTINPSDFNIAYTGNMGPAQDLTTLIDAASLASRSIPNLRVHLVGDGISMSDLRDRARRSGEDIFRFHGRQGMGRVAAVLERCDAGIVCLADTPLFRITIPSKTQGYLLAGIPIIMAVEGDAARIVQESGAGLTVPPANPVQLAAALAALAAQSPAQRRALGQSGREYYRSRFSVASGLDKYEDLFRALRDSRGAGRG